MPVIADKHQRKYQKMCFAAELPFSYGGVGIFAKSDRFQTIRSAVTGMICKIPQQQYDRSIGSLEFDSLWYENGVVLIGPLSFVNHNCKSPLKFGNPFRKSLKMKPDDRKSWPIDKEICIKYNQEYLKTFKCTNTCCTKL